VRPPIHPTEPAKIFKISIYAGSIADMLYQKWIKEISKLENIMKYITAKFTSKLL